MISNPGRVGKLVQIKAVFSRSSYKPWNENDKIDW